MRDVVCRCRLVVEVVRRDPGGCVLAVSGRLSLPSPGLLTRSLSKALADPGRVLADVSGLRVGSAAAVQVFPSVLAGAGGWPAARLVLFGAGAELARTLTALRVTSTVPLAADETAAWLLLDRRPPVLARHLIWTVTRSPCGGPGCSSGWPARTGSST